MEFPNYTVFVSCNEDRKNIVAYLSCLARVPACIWFSCLLSNILQYFLQTHQRDVLADTRKAKLHSAIRTHSRNLLFKVFINIARRSVCIYLRVILWFCVISVRFIHIVQNARRDFADKERCKCIHKLHWMCAFLFASFQYYCVCFKSYIG